MRIGKFNPVTGDRCFDGSSDEETATKKQLSSLTNLQNALSSGDYTNRFDNYQYDFDYSDISNTLNDVYGGYEDQINKSTNKETAEQQQGAASSLASRGITGGSVLSDTQSKIASNLNESKSNALSSLATNKASDLAGLQETFNNLGLQTTQAAQNVDSNALASLLSTYGISSSLINGLDDTTGWDDALGLVKTGAQSSKGIAELIQALSDRNFKKNIIQVDEINGIPVYEFSYIGDSRRFRGVMSDEIPQDAVVKLGAIEFVDYSRLPGIEFSEV